MPRQETRVLFGSLREAVKAEAKRYGGVAALERELTRRGVRVNHTLLYRVAGPEPEPSISHNKLVSLRGQLQSVGIAVRDDDSLQSAIESLSSFTSVPTKLRAALPKSYLCFRRSFLQQNAINVAHAQLSADGYAITYRETRRGATDHYNVSSVVTGTMLCRHDVLYVIGLSNFELQRPVGQPRRRGDLESARPTLSILRALDRDYRVLIGIHAAVTPPAHDSPRLRSRPLATRAILIETTISAREAIEKYRLLQNYHRDQHEQLRVALDAINDSPIPELLNCDILRFIENKPNDDYGVLIAEVPIPRSTSSTSEP